MQTYDIVMLVVAGGATLFGFLKGFAWQLASLASLVLSYVCAYRFADQLAPHLDADPRWSKYLAMLIIYCATALAVWMAFRVVSGAIDRVKLREFDRQLGGLLGLAKGVLLCTVISFFAVTLSEQTRAAVLKSKSGPYIAEFLHKATPIMPPELTEMLGPYIERLNKGLDPMQTVEHPQLPNPDELQRQILQNLPQNLPPDFNPQAYFPPGQPGVGYQPSANPYGRPSIPYGPPSQPNPYGQPQTYPPR